ncbi:AraC family transcriptional regulator [Weeksellaceae bacterium KMM 9713]|uniref:AraC family transcriptional regulator n=1 Tax=Profundicola chukchiensis TaxID=2961959 RepID=A0A9X4RWG1_9FLAO|nr:AraC family transcriptional regulator [Profundicola chukchiensis]MDG4947055.1 AraC family transcriptional regulator [Profundicola chukchiensis]
MKRQQKSVENKHKSKKGNVAFSVTHGKNEGSRNYQDQESFLEVEGSKDFLKPKVVKQISERLEKFEQTDLFIKKYISLPRLATYCDTNIKYLSYYINEYKEMNYNRYINELKVNYVKDRLRNDPDFRRNSFLVISKLTGFSSQNKFFTIFKEVTAMTPSDYVRQLKNELGPGNF